MKRDKRVARALTSQQKEGTPAGVMAMSTGPRMTSVTTGRTAIDRPQLCAQMAQAAADGVTLPTSRIRSPSRHARRARRRRIRRTDGRGQRTRTLSERRVHARGRSRRRESRPSTMTRTPIAAGRPQSSRRILREGCSQMNGGMQMPRRLQGPPGTTPTIYSRTSSKGTRGGRQ